MENNKYLTEENYEKGKKTLKNISIVVLIIGLLLGGSLIFTGVIKTNDTKKQNDIIEKQVKENKKSRTATEIQADIDKVQAQIDEIDNEIINLRAEKEKLSNEQSKIFRDDHGFSDRYYAKDEEISAKQTEIAAKQKEQSKLESSISKFISELWEVNSGYNDEQLEIEIARNTISTSRYVPFYMFGGFVIIASCMIAGAIYMFSKRREITAFGVQQMMPIAQEGIETIAPTVAKTGKEVIKEMAPAYGEVAKEISKGIKEGVKDEE